MNELKPQDLHEIRLLEEVIRAEILNHTETKNILLLLKALKNLNDRKINIMSDTVQNFMYETFPSENHEQ